MNGKEVKGRAIRVDFAKENPEKMNRENNEETSEEASE